MSVQLIYATTPPATITQEFLSTVLLATLAEIDWQPSGDISLAFVSNQQSRKLNKQFAQNDYATDVLSFNYDDENALPSKVVGEIVICSSIARSQAKDYKSDFRSEIALLLAHGIMHLSGKDHQNTTTQASFDTAQSAIMKSLTLNYRTMPW